LKYGLKKINKMVKQQNLSILRRPQFIGRNIHRRRYMKPIKLDDDKISLTPPQIDIDATADVLVGFSTPFGFLTGMGPGTALARLSNRMIMALMKTIEEKAREIAESKENP